MTTRQPCDTRVYRLSLSQPITSPSPTTCLILWPRLASPPQTWFFSSLVPISVSRDLVPLVPASTSLPRPLVVQLAAHWRRRCLFVDLALALSAALALITGAFQNEAPLKPMTFIKAVLRDRCLRRRWEGHLTGRLNKQPGPAATAGQITTTWLPQPSPALPLLLLHPCPAPKHFNRG